MISSTLAPGFAAQSSDALPELSPSTRPFCAHSSSFAGSLTPSFFARASSSHFSQTLRKSMKSGGLPPVSAEKKSIVSSACTSASVANGIGTFLPLWSNVELKNDSAASATGSGMPRMSEPHSSWLMNPPPTAFRSFSRSRMMRYIARLWLNRSESASSLISSRLPRCLSMNARNAFSSFASYAFFCEHVREQLHIQPGDLDAELLAGRESRARARFPCPSNRGRRSPPCGP